MRFTRCRLRAPREFVLALAGVMGCSTPDALLDAATMDAGAEVRDGAIDARREGGVDGSPFDAGMLDAAPVDDAGSLEDARPMDDADRGAIDAGIDDAGGQDASTPDAAPPDSGSPDVGSLDAGRDGGIDAGPPLACAGVGPDVVVLPRGRALGYAGLTWLTDHYLLRWRRVDATGAYVSYMATMDASGALGAVHAYGAGGTSWPAPEVAVSPTGLGVVYLDGTTPREALYFVRAGLDGAPVAGTTVPFTTATYPRQASIAWNDARSEWAVAWEHNTGSSSRVWFARLAMDGTVIAGSPRHYDGLSGSGVSSTTTTSGHWLESRGDGYAIGYMSYYLGDGMPYHRVLDGLGAAGPYAAVGEERGQSTAYGAFAASSAGLYGYVWSEDSPAPFFLQAHFARIGPTGYVRGSERILTDFDHRASHTQIVFDGTQYVIAWEQANMATGDIQVGCGTMSVDGMTSSFGVATASGPNARPYLAWNGTQHVLLYQHTEGAETELRMRRF